MNRKAWRFVLIVILAATGLACAHMGEDHDKRASAPMQDSSVSDMGGLDHSVHSTSPVTAEKVVVTGFPSLHPLAVHFPIVLLPTGFVLLALGIGFRSLGIKWAGWGTAVAGTAGAWISSSLLHAYAIGLSSATRAVFESHELWAARTVWIATAGVIVGLLRLVWKKGGVWLDCVGLGLFLAASVAVAITGHKGASLTHIHGVGPVGHHLMME